MPRTASFQSHVLGLAVGLILLIGGLVSWITQYQAGKMMESVAEDISLRINREVRASLQELMLPADIALRMLQNDDLVQADRLEARLQRLPAIRAALDGSGSLSSIYAGYGDGSFFFVRRLSTETDRARFDAPAQAAYLVQSIEQDPDRPQGRYLYYDAELVLLAQSERPDYPRLFDPRRRDWYRNAAPDGGLLVTPPYPYFSDQQSGITMARRVPGADVVIGVDIRLHTLGTVLARQKVTPGTRLALVDLDGRVIARDDPEPLTVDANGIPRLPTLTGSSFAPFRGQEALIASAHAAPSGNAASELSAAQDTWLLSAARLQFHDADPKFTVIAIPESELMAGAHRQRNIALAITLLVLCVAVPLAWLLARQIVRPLNRLASDAEAIRRFNFAEAGVPQSHIREVAVLGEAMDAMRKTIRRFLELNTAVAGEPDFDSLLPRLLGETLSATYARGGVLYLATDGQLALVAAFDAQGRSLADGALWSPSGGDTPDAASQALHPLDALGPLLGKAIATRKVQAAPLSPADVQSLGVALPAELSGGAQAVAVPLVNRQNELVGAMLLLLDATADDNRLAFIGALSGLAAVTLEARALIAAQKALLEALVRVIAGAIDAKSHHTGGHCARVPELARLLAQAACDARSGPYAAFALDAHGWETLRFAAWLHDCGKITTPEYVVDKGTKLQTLYDRIHEVRMRFEVLKREAALRCLEDILAGAPPQARQRQRDAELAALDEDFAFVARCNQGGESMADADLERLRRIAQRTWTRTLDDRLGLCHEELERKTAVPAPSLPCQEPLLADRPEHLLARRPQERIEADNPWGFRMQAPEWHQNLGELHNLGVRQGTLTEEERYLIRHHIIQTEIMLRQLPFPRHLADVPEVAASHHEKMDGTGYPKGLQAAQMSPLARMMAVADVFEALTAGDRPYKLGKPLSEALSIMAAMARSGHLDPSVFALLLRSGAYLDYAQRFLPAAQIDAIDIDALLSGLEAHPA